MEEKYVPFGGDKHIVKSDCKLCGFAPYLFGSVVFRSQKELDALIAALTELQNGWENPTGHIHLQDFDCVPTADPTSFEVTFCTPAWSDTEFEKDIRESSILEAKKFLSTRKSPRNAVDAVLQQLARGPEIVRQLIYEMPAELRKRRPAPGMWSAHEHAVHLPAVHPIMLRRLDLMLSDPAPFIKSYEPSRDDDDGALLKLDLDDEMDRLERERAAMVARLRTLTPEQWAIAAEHEEYSQYSVFIMFRHVALHDMHHAYKIEERLLRKDWS